MNYSNTKPGIERIRAAQQHEEKMLLWAIRDCNKAGAFYRIGQLWKLKKWNALDRLFATGKIGHVKGHGYVAANHFDRAWVAMYRKQIITTNK